MWKGNWPSSRARLGIKPRINAAAVRAAYAAQQAFNEALLDAGREALARLEETGEPALVLVGRPYNLFDRSVNCDIPRKLRTLYGVNVLPMEVLPLDEEDISDVNANMYWNSGRRILAAAQFIAALPQLAPGLYLQLQVRSRLLHQIVY